MNLIIDIGNTRSKLGIFGKGKLIRKGILDKGWGVKELQAFIANRKIENAAIATVAGLDEKVAYFLKEKNFYLKLSASTPLPIKNTYKTPKTLGNDRLAAVIGANFLFPKKVVWSLMPELASPMILSTKKVFIMVATLLRGLICD